MNLNQSDWDENLKCSFRIDVLIKACESQHGLGGVEEVVDSNVRVSEQSLKGVNWVNFMIIDWFSF